MGTVLEFEKPILEIQEKIEELKKMSLESGMDLNKDIEVLEQEAEDFKKELFSNLDPTQKMQIARHPERPNFMDYVNHMCTDFIEMHGDRVGTDDRAIVGGLAKIDGKPVMIIGTKKTLNITLVCHSRKVIEKPYVYSSMLISLIFRL